MSDQYYGLGCSDGNCCIRNNKGGMHTNGGCKCLRYAREAEKVKKLIAVCEAVKAHFVAKNASQADAALCDMYDSLRALEKKLGGM